MRIAYPVAHTFAEVGVTDLFTFWDDDKECTAMKIAKVNGASGAKYNAVDMADGLLLRFDDDDPVCFLEGSYVVKR
jgi:hypothetical protein